MMKKRTMLLPSLLLAAAVCLAAGCAPQPHAPEHTLSFLKAEGAVIQNAEGEEVPLHGVNAGGLGVIEGWMTGFATERSAPGDGSAGGDIRVRDHLTISQVWTARFGLDEAAQLWSDYRSKWWTEQDFENCRNMGINVIRLPFTYMNVDFAAVQGLSYAGEHYDFTFLDDFVERAEQYGIYTILDMHGAYGSQNGQDHSGETISSSEQVDFYRSEEKIALTEKLWGALAEHFKDNPAVAGYDILNEPGEKGGLTSQRHWDVFDRLYRAIREKDEGHIVIFESCWDENGLPMPDVYGWENCMYSFHHYTLNEVPAPQTPAENFESMRRRVEGLLNAGFGVPIHMGEFTCYDMEEFWNQTLSLFNDSHIHWTTWTYKVVGNMAWGIINLPSYDNAKVNAHTDSPQAAREKFDLINTETGYYYTFRSGTRLYDVIKKWASPAPAAEEGGEA